MRNEKTARCPLPTVALLTVLSAVALAGSACVSEAAHQSTLSRLKQLEAEQSACELAKKKALAGSEAALADCVGARKQLADMGANLKASAAELDELRRQRGEAEKRLAAFKALTAKFQKMIDAGALRVRIRDGRMLLDLPSGVLFKSGQADLSPKGQTTLASVAGVLKELTDRRFLVAGHTDSVPIKSSEHKDNWDLSTARALVVTKFLIQSGMNPKNLGAAGYSMYDPAASNRAAKGRHLNRRIEIVLQPNIAELPRLPE